METKIVKFEYEAPLVEVIKIKVEKGFANSNLENPSIDEETEW